MTLNWPEDQPILDGETIILRPWRPEDAQAVFEACQDRQLGTGPIELRGARVDGLQVEQALLIARVGFHKPHPKAGALERTPCRGARRSTDR